MLKSEKRNADPRRLVDGSMATNLAPVRFESTNKRIRVLLGGSVVADTINALLVWEHPYYPRYYFPMSDVTAEALCHDTSGIDAIAEHVAFDWDAMDAWFEEDEEVFVHARNPYSRVDALRSSRHVRVEIDGTTVAESNSPVVLFETGLPLRYYLPALDVRQDLLTPTEQSTDCPYKGTAKYWSVGDHENIVWSYEAPVPESRPIQGLRCFYNEKVDIYVDGELETKPASPFS
jgi:uncharacterized protein (DUF427 family)